MRCTLGTVQSPLDLSEEEWNQAIRTNLTGTWLVSKYVGRHMRDAKQGGSIINISSIAGLDRGQLPGGHAYAASKTGVNVLTKVMSIAMQLFQIIGVIPLSFFVIVWKHNNYYKMKNHGIFIEECTTEERKPHTKPKKKFTSIILTIGK